MSPSVETIFVATRKIACDGDKGSGHPRVFLTMGKNDSVDCPYCGRHYVLKEDASVVDAH
jgi:uncharacterized Zn-finger protein